MDKSLIKEEMMMEHNTEITEEEVMQIIATQTATATARFGGVLVFVIVGILIYKTLKKEFTILEYFSFKWNIH